MPLRVCGLVPGLAGLLLVLPSIACGAAGPTPAEIPAGTWVGDGARATVSSEGASLTLGWAGAAIAPPLTLDGEGRFDLAGGREHRAGPEPYRRRDARLRGRARGMKLTPDIALLDGTETQGPYELRLGGSGRPPTSWR